MTQICIRLRLLTPASLPLSTEYNPAGYLPQPAEMNGYVLEYTTLAGTSRINGNVHRGYGHSGPMLTQGCHHLHHKVPNGLALLNGTGGLFSPAHPHGHDGTLPYGTRDCEHSHPHHHHNVSDSANELIYGVRTNHQSS